MKSTLALAYVLSLTSCFYCQNTSDLTSTTEAKAFSSLPTEKNQNSSLNTKEFTPPIYDEIDPFDIEKKGWAIVKLNGKYGFINKQGKEVVEPIYDDIDPFDMEKKGWAIVKLNGKPGFINRKGEFVD